MLPWSSVKLHIHVSTRPTSMYTILGPNGYTPSQITGTNYNTSYSGNDLLAQGTNIQLYTPNAGAISISANQITMVAEKYLGAGGKINVLAKGDLDLQSDAGSLNMVAKTSSELYFANSTNTNTFKIYNTFSSTFIPFDLTLPKTGTAGALTFRDLDQVKFDYTGIGTLVSISKPLEAMFVNGAIYAEGFITLLPSSYEYKEYAYCVNKETEPSFCSIKKGVPECKGFE